MASRRVIGSSRSPTGVLGSLPFSINALLPKMAAESLAKFETTCGLLILNLDEAEYLAQRERFHALAPDWHLASESDRVTWNAINHEMFHYFQTVATGYQYITSARIHIALNAAGRKSKFASSLTNLSDVVTAWLMIGRPNRENWQSLQTSIRLLEWTLSAKPRSAADASLAGAMFPDCFARIDELSLEERLCDRYGVSALGIIESAAVIYAERITYGETDLRSRLDRAFHHVDPCQRSVYQFLTNRYGDRALDIALPAAAISLCYERPAFVFASIADRLFAARRGAELSVARQLWRKLPRVANGGAVLGTARAAARKLRNPFHDEDLAAFEESPVDEFDLLCAPSAASRWPRHNGIVLKDAYFGAALEPEAMAARIGIAHCLLRSQSLASAQEYARSLLFLLYPERDRLGPRSRFDAVQVRLNKRALSSAKQVLSTFRTAVHAARSVTRSTATVGRVGFTLSTLSGDLSYLAREIASGMRMPGVHPAMRETVVRAACIIVEEDGDNESAARGAAFLQLLGSHWLDERELRSAETCFGMLHHAASARLAQCATDARWYYYAASALKGQGDAQSEQGRLRAARRTFGQTLQLLEGMRSIEQSSLSSEQRANLAKAYGESGVALARLGGLEMHQRHDIVAARRAYEQSEAVTRLLIELEPGNLQWQEHLAVSLDEMAELDEVGCELSAARSRRLEALKIEGRLLDESPANTHIMRNLSGTLIRLARVEHRLGLSQDALSHARASQALDEELVVLEPMASDGLTNLQISRAFVRTLQEVQLAKDEAR